MISAQVQDLYGVITNKTKLAKPITGTTKFKDVQVDLHNMKTHGVTLSVSHTGWPWSRPPPIELVNMDPYIGFSEISCRYPSCKGKTGNANNDKRDLFLCEQHRRTLQTLLINQVRNTLKKHKTDIAIMPILEQAAMEPKSYQGYTKLIPLLDAVCHEKVSLFSTRSSGRLVLDMCLNVRNFFLLFNTLLNPNGDNMNFLGLVIPLLRIFFEIFHELQNSIDLQLVRDIVRGIVEGICYGFGINYHWLADIYSTTGGLIGGGIGLAVGLGVGLLFAPVAVPLLVAAGGGLAGGMLGAGIERDFQQQRGEREHEEERRAMIQLWQREAPNQPLFQAIPNVNGALHLEIIHMTG